MKTASELGWEKKKNRMRRCKRYKRKENTRRRKYSQSLPLGCLLFFDVLLCPTFLSAVYVLLSLCLMFYPRCHSIPGYMRSSFLLPSPSRRRVVFRLHLSQYHLQIRGEISSPFSFLRVYLGMPCILLRRCLRFVSLFFALLIQVIPDDLWGKRRWKSFHAIGLRDFFLQYKGNKTRRIIKLSLHACHNPKPWEDFDDNDILSSMTTWPLMLLHCRCVLQEQRCLPTLFLLSLSS